MADPEDTRETYITSLEAENASLRDQYNAEREARQALLHTALDLRENAILEIEHAYGQHVTPKRMDALIEHLRPVLEAQDYKLKQWGTPATMRLACGRALAVRALEDALAKLKGKVRHG